CPPEGTMEYQAQILASDLPGDDSPLIAEIKAYGTIFPDGTTSAAQCQIDIWNEGNTLPTDADAERYFSQYASDLYPYTSWAPRQWIRLQAELDADQLLT